MNPSTTPNPLPDPVPHEEASFMQDPGAPRPMGYCRVCGTPVFDASALELARSSVYCPTHRAAAAAGEPPSPYAVPATPLPNSDATAWVAFIVGLIPGVGAIYNGQYAKGIVHAILFGLLISILSSDATGGFEPLFGMMVPIFVLYMAFEAYHTAKLKARGLAVDEFSGVFAVRTDGKRSMAGPIALIALGVLFLLINMEVIQLAQLMRFWPVFLIVLGAYLLFTRVSGRAVGSLGSAESMGQVRHDS